MLPSSLVHVLRRCLPGSCCGVSCATLGDSLLLCSSTVRGDLPVPGTNSTPRCSTFTCRVVTNLRPSLRSMSLSLTGSPARSISRSCGVISVLPMRSGMRMRAAGMSVISLVLRSMLMNEGVISPVALSTKSTILPRLPVSFRAFFSSGVNLCPLYSSSFCSLRMKWGTSRTLPSSSLRKDRRASRLNDSPPKLGVTRTRSDLP